MSRWLCILLAIPLFATGLSHVSARPGRVPPPRVPAGSQPPATLRPSIFTGTVVFISSLEIQVQGKDPSGNAGTMRFLIESDTRVPKDLKSGAHVVVNYAPSKTAGSSKALSIVALPGGTPAPRPTGTPLPR